MKNSIKTLIGLALLAGIVFTGVQVTEAAGAVQKPALLVSHKDTCLSNGGTWSNTDPTFGECTYPPGSAGHRSIGVCTGEQNTIISYSSVYVPVQGRARFSRTVSKPNQGVAFWTRCENISSGPGYGKCGDAAGKTDEAVTINTCHGTSVAFAAGACTGKCTVGPQVLNTAKKGLSQLDGEVLGQAYVKVRNPAGGSYKICFNGEGTIYKWVSGVWVAQSTQTVGGVSCAWSSGDGNYVLVTP